MTRQKPILYFRFRVHNSHIPIDDVGVFNRLDCPKSGNWLHDVKVTKNSVFSIPISDTTVINYDELKAEIVTSVNGGCFNTQILWFSTDSIEVIGELSTLNPNAQEIIRGFLEYSKIPYMDKLNKVYNSEKK